MASDSNLKNNQFRVVLPVIFTFGASLVFFQGNAHADDANVTANTAVTTTQTSDNQQSSNYQNANVALMTAQAVQTHAAEQLANTDPNKGAVDISAENAQNVANAPAVDTQPNVSTNQISNTQADPENGTASTTVSGTGNINTNGLSARNVQFLESIHQGAVDGWKQFGVLPSLTGAQAIIESGWGQSALTTQGHNLFGIKGAYNGQSVTMPTYEYYGGRYVQINDAFRAYPSNYESIVDHGRFLKENSRYSNLIGQKDYQTVTRLIRQDGYATDPQYTNTLNRVIRQYNLTAWDQEAFNDNINTGHIDNVSIQGNTLKVEGWHATNNYDQSMHHFIILLDGNTKQELYRQEVPGTYRQDVQNVYPNAKISGWGGFSLTVPNSANFAGKAIQVVSRYTKNTNGEPNGGDDLWFNSVNLNTNAGYLDNFNIDAATNTLNISGWHATDQSAGKDHHFIILYDATKNRELGRYEVNSAIRNDVAKVYNVYNAGKSGFNLQVNISPALIGDNIQVISRYSNAANGEGNYVDYWFAPKTFNANQSYLDQVTISDNQVHVSGWQAADASVKQQNHFVILYDATTHREITRKQVSNVSRPDVQRSYPNIANAGKSGFDVTFDFNRAAYAGHQLQVISRYSDANNGEGNRTDAWFAPTTVPSSNQGFLDSFVVKNGEVTVTGWQAADQSYNQKNHFVILYDATTHREIGRQQVTNLDRPDVQKAYPSIYNSAKSGFKAAFKLDSSLIGHEIQVVSRYSYANNGEGNRTDFWFDAIKLPQNLY
ncbi:glycoside hydrolase family 73 protein [Limosilactobacillus reuteri]|uniref:glycoside hydrolase family 73 protein n=1 Tax=Limosilactobacillus reuteri TaxID=1598 RepID=UPI00128DC109|nr:glycoside hydrolase family 73 protein [Limosilactobacillus reuteri]MQB59943.1 mannosyl-glycoprotein endo-beta-N-acetylglucosamidase [Limosilactobacillus reuteri]MQB83345.1 mannosyl-glycoprotein endo-beta-N-acetylglucosamidase [Limosilactobacillus reuteri]